MKGRVGKGIEGERVRKREEEECFISRVYMWRKKGGEIDLEVEVACCI